jgi:aminoglycoside phosphotransferase (APT) family kinase protein
VAIETSVASTAAATPTLDELRQSPLHRQVFDWIKDTIGGEVTSFTAQARWRPMWNVDVERDGERLPLVVRHARPDTALFTLEHEFRHHKVMHDQGIRVPKVYGWVDGVEAYVMERLENVRPDFNGVEDSVRDVIVDGYVQELVRLHSLPVEPFIAAGIVHPERPEESGLVGLNQMEAIYRRLKNHPNPFAEFAIGWVRRHPPQSHGRQSAVVWDSGQFLHRDGRFVSIIDVENGYVGDPMADLAGWRQRESVLRCGDFNRIYDRYGEYAGAPVDREAIQLHHIATTLWNELPFAHVFRDPPAITDYVVNLQWVNETNLFFTDGVAEYLGLELPTIEMPEPRKRQVTGAHRHLVRTLREMESERIRQDADVSARDDFVHGLRHDVVAYQLRTVFRLARHLERYMEIGDAVEAADLDDIAQVTGSRPDDWLEGEAELERFVLTDAATGEYDLPLLDLFHKRLQRQLILNGPPGSAIATHHPVQPFG